jgi:hypothetical protein
MESISIIKQYAIVMSTDTHHFQEKCSKMFWWNSNVICCWNVLRVVALLKPTEERG